MPPNEAGACESLQEGVRVCVGLSLFLCSLSLSLSLSPSDALLLLPRPMHAYPPSSRHYFPRLAPNNAAYRIISPFPLTVLRFAHRLRWRKILSAYGIVGTSAGSSGVHWNGNGRIRGPTRTQTARRKRMWEDKVDDGGRTTGDGDWRVDHPTRNAAN